MGNNGAPAHESPCKRMNTESRFIFGQAESTTMSQPTSKHLSTV